MQLNTKKSIIFITGVSGSGKSTIGNLLAKELNIPFLDGDDFHPASNIEKMASGKPLNDDDRYKWLLRLNTVAKEQLNKNGCIIACSALKEKYRTLLKDDIEDVVKWFFLNGTFDQILNRMKERSDHFMPPSLLQSQFDTLEVPENAIKIEISSTPKEIINTIKNRMDMNVFGLIGLGVMGKSLCRNLARNNFAISMYNRHVPGKEEKIALDFKNTYTELDNSMPFDVLSEFVDSLEQPRKIMLMVNAGKAVDAVIDDLLPLLSIGDIIIDGGNSHYNNTQKRYHRLKEKGIHFLGIGVSGGEEGALKGPSMMPGGDAKAYAIVKPYLESIAAKDKNGEPCCHYLGDGGAGHFIKMVHNGIEYSEMQLLAETYYMLRIGMGKNPDEIAAIFENWAKSDTNSYLLEITAKIIKKKEDNTWLIDLILDKAGNKGTGNWTTVAAAQLGIPITLLTEALYSRYISSFKQKRVKAATIYNIDKEQIQLTIDEIQSAYQFARIINHHQGIMLLREASKAYEWNLNVSEICRVWTNGCIIRSVFMEQLHEILKRDTDILLHTTIIEAIKKSHPSLTKVASENIKSKLSTPCFSAAINYFNNYIEGDSNANIIQAQRDFFGAHTYQRKNDKSEQFYHTNWD